MKNLLFLFLVLLVVSCETPYKIVETYTTDSTGKTVKVVNKYYSTGSSTTYVPVSNVYIPDASYNIYNSPVLYPYYRPTIVPRIVVPIAPRYNYNNSAPRYRRH